MTNRFDLDAKEIIDDKLGKQLRTKKLQTKWKLHIYAIPTLLSLFHVMYKTKVINRKYVPKRGPFIIMSNHRSHMDEFFIGFSAFPTFFRPFYYPADVKLWKNPFFKPILEGMNCIPQ